MILDKKVAHSISELLLQIKSIKLDTKNSFTWASGWHSPVYCDNRILLSHPKARDFVALQMANQINEKFPGVEIIAGVATGAIGIGVLVADILETPFVYVRPEPKKHGRKNRIEGQLKPNAKVVVVEDLISTGKSSLAAVDALRESMAQVLGMIAIFSYDFEISKEYFEVQNLPVYTLSDYSHLIEKAIEANYVSNDEVEILEQWRTAPETWNT